MSVNRRTVLKAGAAAGALATFGSLPVYAKSPVQMLGSNALNDDTILIIIQLFGGNDGLNTIIPADDPNYYKIRPSIGVPQNRAKRIFNSKVYFHPALVENITKNGFLGLIEEGRLAVIQGSGYENPNLSHFRSTDIWLSGINSSDPNIRLNEGWLGRYFADQLPEFPTVIPDYPLCVQMGGSLSMLFQSKKGDMGIALADPDKFFQLGQGLNPDESAMAGATPYADEFNFIRTVARQSDSYSAVVKNAFDKGKNTLNYASGFGDQMKLIARLISGGLKTRVYMAYLGGFDTHVQQQDGNLGGLHPNLLRSLATGISQFMTDALQQGFANRVVGLTVSEFGRRPYENGSRGTDHGTTSVQFAFGTRVQANVFGNDPNLGDFDGNGDLSFDLQRNVDYRRIYAEILQTWFGASKDDVQKIFGERIVPLPFLQPPSTSAPDIIPASGDNALSCWPNPVMGNNAVLNFELKKDSKVEINLFNPLGTFNSTIFDGLLQAGYHTIPIQLAGCSAGAYICELTAGQIRRTIIINVTH
jgi:uncharacterized protein (DUF1501 family)